MHSKNMERDSQSFLAVVLAAFGVVMVLSLAAIYMNAARAQDKPVPVSDAMYVEDEFGTVIRLFKTECKAEDAAVLMVANGVPASNGLMVAAVTYQDKEYAGCWTQHDDHVDVIVPALSPRVVSVMPDAFRGGEQPPRLKKGEKGA